MKVILLEEVKGRGGEGDVIDVARGFANNYLLRNGMAVLATKGNLKQLEQRRHNIAKREEVRIADAEALREKLEGLKVFVKARVGEEGQLFGSVTSAMVAEAIKEQAGIEIDKRRIDIRVAIKTAGEHEAEVSLYRSIMAKVQLLVGEEPVVEEAEEAAEGEGSGEEAAEGELSEEEVDEIFAQAGEAVATVIGVVDEAMKVAEGGAPAADGEEQ